MAEMGYQTILFEMQGAAAWLALNRPEKLNSFNVQMHMDVRGALDEVQQNGGVRVLVITGAGRAFCTGQDLADRAVSPGENVDLGASIENY
jgi:2-(1,2-epoxy-1,2-dihydrophenyl)acetyl-CoA isomerase